MREVGGWLVDICYLVLVVFCCAVLCLFFLVFDFFDGVCWIVFCVLCCVVNEGLFMFASARFVKTTVVFK